MLWGYPGILSWRESLGLPVVTAGKLYGMTGSLGVAGDLTGNMSYFGVCHLFLRDNGLYVAAVMRDGRTGGNGSDIGQPEGQGGQIVQLVTKPGAKPRTLLLAGGQDGRVTEIHGLDTIKPLPDQAFTMKPEDVTLATQVLAEYNAKAGKSGKMVIVEGEKQFVKAKSASKSLDGNREFTTRLARDDQNLYILFDVKTPHELVNSMSDPTLVFKGGNCLDIQIGTDPEADPKRKTPVPGDFRLLVTRQAATDGKTAKPLAVLYRPKVKDFKGQPIVLNSPTGKESFDEITVIDNMGLDYRKTGDGFQATVTIPLKSIGLRMKKDDSIPMDLGYLYGNATGSQVAARSYLTNNSFAANVVNDIPHESRLEPAEWGKSVVE
jgi:hypothetical protein